MRVLNIRCGDDLRGRIAGDYLSYVDPLCQGPVTGTPGSPAFTERRARFIATHYGVSFHAGRARLVSELQGLARARDYERVLLWFEHDLYDQAILAFLLSWFARHRLPAARLRLVEIDHHPNHPRFIGLGQLSDGELTGLGQRTRAVTPERLRLAVSAWHAYSASDPAMLERIACGESSLFAGAAQRHLREFPWVRDGLSLTERLALQAVADGAKTAGEAFRSAQSADPQPFLGGAMFFAVLRGLRHATEPALTDDAGLTDFGRALLAGKADWIAANGSNRWLGGVRLRGAEARWRWDDGEGRLVELYKAP